MGILNVTPDSFSDGSLHFGFDKAVARGRAMEDEGADILDVGGESTRPGSVVVSEAEEIRRVVPVIEALAPRLTIPISVDTYRMAVAKRSFEAGAQIVNDISGLRFEPHLAGVVRRAGAGIVLMHSRGQRETLHQRPPLRNPVRAVFRALERSLGRAARARIAASTIAVDPGIGFGKDADGNLKILKSLEVFSKLNSPLLVGTSRKSFIWSALGESGDARIWGTAATVAVAIRNGAHIVRVHDVSEMRWVARLADRMT